MCNALNHPLGCTCGFGGEGHLGRSIGSFGDAYSPFIKKAEELRRPFPCKYCRQEIYFVRYNGGTVWFDSLGQPWPKHDCPYYQISVNQTERKEGQKVADWLQKTPDAFLGIVSNYQEDMRELRYGAADQRKGNGVVNAARRNGCLVVDCSDGVKRLVQPDGSKPLHIFFNALVAFSLTTGSLLLPDTSVDEIIQIGMNHIIADEHGFNYIPSASTTHSTDFLATCHICGDVVDRVNLISHRRNFHSR